MKARIKWVEEVSFLGETESGHAVLMDGPPAGGGRNLGPRPMEMLLIGTGACTAYDVVTILKKSRQQITDCVVDIQSERADTDPKVFTGKNLRREQVERAILLSAEKYCSASIMLGKTAEVTHDFEIVEA
jgi:putative redox protein